MIINGRQVGKTLDEIRIDHISRYKFACNYIKKDDVVGDLGCGCGYGCKIMADNSKAETIHGIDFDKETIEFARLYYNKENITYIHNDILSYTKYMKDVFNVITAFELIQQVENIKKLLKIISKLLTKDGTFILSTPNSKYYPFNNNPFHYKHYSYEEISDLLYENGFSIKEMYSQKDGNSEIVEPGLYGMFMILVCKKED